MHQQNSSISISSEKQFQTSETAPASDDKRYRLFESFKLVGWLILFLVLADTAINLLFAYPTNPEDRPNRLEQYFEYGRSREGKLRRIFGPTEETSFPITEPGWLDDPLFEDLPTQPEAGHDLLISAYGGSFNGLAAGAIRDQYSDSITVRNVSAPEGPLNWAYAAYQMDRNQHQADASILTVISYTAAVYAMGGQFQDVAIPYTRPIYSLDADGLQQIDPVLQTLPEFRQALLNDPDLWQAHLDRLSQYDPYYNPVLFKQTWLDYSSLLRLSRRWYGKSVASQIRDTFYGEEGFKPESEVVQVMKTLVTDFAAAAREDGVLPVVYLANTRGWSNHLYEVLKPVLEENSIPYVSSHTIVSVNDPSLLLSDGHYIPEKDIEIADQLVRVIRQNLSESAQIPVSEATSPQL